MTNFDEAVEKVKWHCVRWRIEVFHKILKSGFKGEECRLGTGKKINKIFIIAWRMFFITLVARTSPNIPCTTLLTDEEWRILCIKIRKSAPPNAIIPTIKDAIISAIPGMV